MIMNDLTVTEIARQLCDGLDMNVTERVSKI